MPVQQKRRNHAPDRSEEEERAYNAGTPVQATGNVSTIDLEELMYQLLGNWKLIVCLAVSLALIAGAYTSFFVTPLYEATSIIYVLSNRESAINMSDLQLGSALTQDYIKVFRMWEVHEEVISNLNLPYSYSQMQSMLSVVNDTDTRMLDITVTSSDPQEAADIANAYAQVASQYIADTMATDKPNIMSAALAPSNPVSPNRSRNIMVGFFLGGMIAVGIVTMRMIINDKYKTAEEIRKYTGLVTLAVVPMEEYEKSGQRRFSRNRRKT